jgi:hypothetical protein
VLLSRRLTELPPSSEPQRRARAADILPVIHTLRQEGVTTLAAIAFALNERGIPAPRGGYRSRVSSLWNDLGKLVQHQIVLNQFRPPPGRDFLDQLMGRFWLMETRPGLGTWGAPI